jgi:Flp pilus assembly protein TadG
MLHPRDRRPPRPDSGSRGGWRLRGRTRRGLGREGRGLRGEGPVEFAILAFPLLLFTFMLVQASLVWYAHSVALGAATQGANTGRLFGSSAAAGRTKALDFLARVGPAMTDPVVTARITGNEVTVVVRGKARTVIPGMTFTVTQSASGPVERFIP